MKLEDSHFLTFITCWKATVSRQWGAALKTDIQIRGQNDSLTQTQPVDFQQTWAGNSTERG